jgi:antitoxin component of MazEF toxin-antitoxin module
MAKTQLVRIPSDIIKELREVITNDIPELSKENNAIIVRFALRRFLETYNRGGNDAKDRGAKS